MTFVRPAEANLTYSVSYKDLSGADKTAEGSRLTLPQGAQATAITITGNNSAATVPVWNGKTFTKVALSGVSAETVKIAAVMDGKVVNANYGVLTKGEKDNTFKITLSGGGHEFDGYASKLGTVYFYLYTGATAPAIAADAATALFTLTVEPASLNALLKKSGAEVTLSKTEDNDYTATLKDGVVTFENVTVDSEVVIPGGSKLIVADEATYAGLTNTLTVKAGGELYVGTQPIIVASQPDKPDAKSGTYLSAGKIELTLAADGNSTMTFKGTGDDAGAASAMIYGWPDTGWTAVVESGATITFYSQETAVATMKKITADIYGGAHIKVYLPEDGYKWDYELVGTDETPLNHFYLQLGQDAKITLGEGALTIAEGIATVPAQTSDKSPNGGGNRTVTWVTAWGETPYNVIVAEGATFGVKGKLDIAPSSTLTNNGTITVNGTLNNSGTITNTGVINATNGVVTTNSAIGGVYFGKVTGKDSKAVAEALNKAFGREGWTYNIGGEVNSGITAAKYMVVDGLENGTYAVNRFAYSLTSLLLLCYQFSTSIRI